jgi:hypothetical protein
MGMADTLKCPFSPDETHDIQRAKKVKILKLGLMRYVAKTPLSQFMNISFSEPLSQIISTDSWNNWVYSASLHAYSQGQKTYNYGYYDGTLSANRITEESKFQSSLSYDLARNRNVYLETVYRSSTHDEYLHLSYVKRITDHWSAGGLIYMQTSSYSNFDLYTRIMPSIEYNIFPYAESTRRQLRFLYRAWIEMNKYSELTIRNKLS